MSRKHIVAASLLLPFIALSHVAHAGPQGSDRAWWPNQSNGYGPSRTTITEAVAARVPVAPLPSGNQATCRYQGGPRSPLVCTTQP
jgi:hypothetical protein